MSHNQRGKLFQDFFRDSLKLLKQFTLPNDHAHIPLKRGVNEIRIRETCLAQAPWQQDEAQRFQVASNRLSRQDAIANDLQ